MTNKYEPIHLLESAKQEGLRPGVLLQVKDVATLLGVHPNTVRNWTDCGDLRSYRVGRRRDRRVPIEAVSGLLGVFGHLNASSKVNAHAIEQGHKLR